MGPRGKFVVAGFAIFEFFGGSCLTLMVLWRQVITILPAEGGSAHCCGSMHPVHGKNRPCMVSAMIDSRC